ncbi:low temperature requirement protein A [Auraticoccus sp. F435]|uniref:Low temperature requirement protein A n=1 Tax=Auraticoccus cholistanensis TaxID=2656650 RepID=A0A6A9V2B3_9ACTN|nr:low temperature requirement protein A [Auraticoccus cholistanensis]MVA77770.1 low temperature requirement protein A [Auraticoccus cholistanensis]
MSDDRRAPEPLVRPPRLHLGREGNANRLELFFDLAYVLAVMQLAAAFYDDLSWHGLWVLVGLFVALWFSWVGFTLYANRFDTDDVVFRVAKLAATGAIAGCAASASGALGPYGIWFAGCYLLAELILLALYARAWRHVEEGRRTIVVYLVTLAVSAVVWAVSMATPGTTRYVLWAVAVLVSAVAPVLATFRSSRLPLHIAHLPERFGLLVILVLGEAVGGAVRGVHDSSWATDAVVAGAVAFVFAAGMWWVYFDVTARSGERELEDADDEAEPREQGSGEDEEGPVDQRHDLFVYGHLPVALGVVLVGVGLEDLVAHPMEPTPSDGSWVLAGGLAVFLAGAAMIIAGTTRTLRSIWPWPSLGILVVLAGALLPLPASLVDLGIYAVVVLAIAVHGTVASRRRDTALGGDD